LTVNGKLLITLSDRVRGCIVGGAVGDAMGGPFEGQPDPVQFREPDNWSISDDTQLTLATCEAITQTKRVSPEQRFLKDCSTRCPM